MRETSSEQTAQSRESASVTSPILVHEQRQESLAERTQHLISIKETDTSGIDSTGDKLLREAQVLTWGVGGAFGDVVTDPLSKLPEAATAGVFGVGIRTLEKAGTKGKVLAGVVGAGMFAKMGYDEWRGQRWSEFGGAMEAAWESKANFYDSVEATKHSVGSLAVDMTVGAVAFKAAGAYDPVFSKSSLISKGETSMSFENPGRALSQYTEFSRMGERTSRALGEAAPPLRMITRPPAIREFAVMGERCTTALSDAPNKFHVSGSHSVDAVRAKPHGPAPQDLVTSGEQKAKISPAIENAVPPHKVTLTEALKSKLLTDHKMEEFGYLSAIREVAAVETAPGFVANRASYQAIAETVESMSRMADSDFAHHYHAVAELVKQHAESLKN